MAIVRPSQPLARRARRSVRRLGAGPDRWRWLLLVSLAGHVAALVGLRLLPREEPVHLRSAVAIEVLRPTSPIPSLADRQAPTDEVSTWDPLGPVVAATAEAETPDVPTDRQAARDQRAHDGPDRLTPHPGPEGIGAPGLASQSGVPMSQRGGPRQGPDHLAHGRQSGGGAPTGGPSPPHAGRQGARPASRGVPSPSEARLSVPWEPMATRARPARAGFPTPVAAAHGTPAASVHRSVASPTRAQGSDHDAHQPRPIPAAAHPSDGAVPTVRREPLGDPVAELREALGWGPLDRAALAPRPDDGGRIGLGSGTDRSGPDLAEPSSWVRATDARGTELGAWAEAVDERVRVRWEGLDLSLDDRARGLQGDVGVRYHVLPSGRVRSVAVVRSSGHPALDALAVGAVPARLPRPPASTRPEGIVYEHILGYRNPLVLISPR